MAANGQRLAQREPWYIVVVTSHKTSVDLKTVRERDGGRTAPVMCKFMDSQELLCYVPLRLYKYGF